jgi:hypothetical protein
VPLKDSPKLREETDADIVQARINMFETTLRLKIAEFFSQGIAHWRPPESASQEAQEFYRTLGIPLVDGMPSLLFHQLHEHPNPNGKVLFEGKHK